MADAVTQSADKLVGALNEAQKTSTTNIKIKADYEDLEKANKILEEMEAARKSPRLIDVATIDNNGNEIYQKASNPQHISNVSQASNYYKSIDTAKNAMAEQWNKLVGYMENNPAVNLESMINSKQSLSTSVLRYANAFEALGGDISSVSEELATFVSQMRNLDELSASKGFSFTVDNFKNIFSYLDRLRDEAGAVFSDFNIKDSLHIDFRSMPGTAFGTNTFANEGAREAEEAAERTEEAAERTKEAAKKYAEATQEVMEARLNAKHKKQDADEWDIWGFDAGTDHSLKDLQAKLKELQEQKDSVLYSLTDLNNRLAKGETEDWAGVSLEDRLNSQIEDYHTYVDQIEYVQNALNDAALNFTPGAEWGEEEIGTTIQLFQTLLQYAGEVKESLASIKSPDEFQVLITSIEAVSERLSDLASSFHSAFDSFDDNGELISITNYFDQLIQNISELSQAMSKLDIKFNIKSTSQSKSPLELADERRREQEAIYDQLLQERSEIEARIYGRFKSAQSPTQMIMSLFGNRKTPGLQNYTEWSAFAEEYSSQAIDTQFKKSMTGANSSLKRYIEKIISGANLAGIDVSDIVKKYEPKKDEGLEQNAQQAQELAKSEEDAANSAQKMQEALSNLLQTTDFSPILDQLDQIQEKLQTIIDIYREYTGIAETSLPQDSTTPDTIAQTADITKDKAKQATSTTDQENPVNQELEQKNDLLTQEAQIVDSQVQGEVEAFEAIEFAIKAIVDQLNQLVAILPQASFDDFVGQDSQTKIAALLKDLEGLTRTLDTIDDQDVFSHLNNLLQSPSQEIGSNIDTITTKFKDLRTVMNGFDDNGSAVFKSLSDLANAGDAIVEKMQKLFSDSGVKLPTTTATQSKQKDVTAASNLMSTQRAEILDAVDNYVSQQPDNLEVVATKMQAGANGIVKVIATVKQALEDGSIAFKEFTFNASDTGDGLNVLLSGTKEGGTTLERQAQAYQKFKEAISDSGDELKTLGDVIGGEVFTQDSAGWPQLIELAREFGMELEDIDKITRKVQNGFESFTFLTKDGVSKTLGFSSDRVLMQTDPVLDRKADEKAQKEAEQAARQRAEQQAKISAEQARIRAEEQKKIQDEYETQMATIDALGKANSDVLFAKADQINGKQNAEQMAEAMEHLAKASDDALNALQKIHEMWDAGQISAEQYYAAYEKYNSDAIQKGSAKSQDAVTQAEFKQIAAAVDELTKSYERLADAENKAANGSTAAVREKGATTAQQIQARQRELEEQIADKTTKEQDARIEAAKKYYARLQTAYESQNTTSPSKDLGFGPDSNVEKTWDTLIAKAQQYQNILNKQDNLHKSLTVNEAAFLNNFADLYDEAGQKAEDAGEKGQKFSEAMEAARSNIRTTTIDNFANIIGNLGATDESMPKAYNDQVVELQANLEKLKNTDFGSSQWGQTIEALSSGLEKLNTDPFMQKASDLSKQTLNRQMSDWINNNSGAGEYLEQVRALQNALSSAASQGDVERIAAGFEKIKSSAAEAGKTGESFGEGLMKRFKSLGQYLLSFASFYKVVDVFKQAIGVVKELDTALVELKKVSDESTQSYSNFMKNSFDMADDVGTTAQSIINSTADWKRLGESFEEAQKSATTSTVLMNVSEFTNINDATQSLVSASQAYKDLDKMDIVDKLNNIGNNFSVSTDELATGLKNAAAVLATQGNDIDQALALLTAGNAVTQDISKTSAGIRTISLRIAGTEEAKNELADMGEDIDDFVVKTRSKTNSIIQDYTAVASNNYKGVSVLDDNGNLRDTYNILLDIAKVYEEIQAEDKKAGTNRAQALIEELAGLKKPDKYGNIFLRTHLNALIA